MLPDHAYAVNLCAAIDTMRQPQSPFRGAANGLFEALPELHSEQVLHAVVGHLRSHAEAAE